MSKRQLPVDRRSRIRQGFAASLLLTPLFFSGFFWLQMSSKGGGASLYRGAQSVGDRSLTPKQRAIGPLGAAVFNSYPHPRHVTKHTHSPFSQSSAGLM